MLKINLTIKRTDIKQSNPNKTKQKYEKMEFCYGHVFNKRLCVRSSKFEISVSVASVLNSIPWGCCIHTGTKFKNKSMDMIFIYFYVFSVLHEGVTVFNRIP